MLQIRRRHYWRWLASFVILLSSCSGNKEHQKVLRPEPEDSRPTRTVDRKNPQNSDDPDWPSAVPAVLAQHIVANYAIDTPQQTAAMNLALAIARLITATVDNDDPLDDGPAQEAYTGSLYCFSYHLAAGYAQGIEAFYDAAARDEDFYLKLLRAEATMSGQVEALPPKEERAAYCVQQQNSTGAYRGFMASDIDSKPQCKSSMESLPSIVYFNGMFTHKGSAIAQTDALKAKVSASNLNPTQYYLAYNRNERFDLQIVQVARDKIADRLMSLRRRMLQVFSLRDALGQPLPELKDPISALARQHGEDLAIMHANIKALLAEGKRLAFVSYSQGNFYANYTYALLTSNEAANTRQIMIATPTDTIMDAGNRWTTFANDLVMLAVRTLLGALPAQPELSALASEDPLGHAFSDAYLMNTRSWPHIYHHIEVALSELEVPSPMPVDGQVRATLSWQGGESKDFSLHVFEGQRHLYYKDRIGNLGRIFEETASLPWDSYETSCALDSTADFRFAIHYYEGTGAGQALLRVEAGDQIREFPLTLGASNGPAGVLKPQIVARVKARQDPSTNQWALKILDQNEI